MWSYAKEFFILSELSSLQHERELTELQQVKVTDVRYLLISWGFSED